MIDWESFQFEQIWPLWLCVGSAFLLFLFWFYHQKTHIPDILLITETSGHSGFLDRLPIISGGVILLLLTILLMEPSYVRIVTVEKQARDFLVIFDTSRSMRHDTTVRREVANIQFERKVGGYITTDDDPDPQSLPYLARYELARESLLPFLSQRRAQDRVGMLYFNDEAFTMSALTTNIDFVVEQLGLMDEYVNFGTNIPKAMEAGLDLFDRYPDMNIKSLILITDAQATYTRGLEDQLSRLAAKGISFYLLWITTDEDNTSNLNMVSLLKYTRSIGTVVTIDNIDTSNLENALRDISRMEAYSYEEQLRERVDLAYPIFIVTRMLLLGWLLVILTYFHPSSNRKTFMYGGKNG